MDKLNKIVDGIASDTLTRINREARESEITEMPYKAQHILEELIKKLEAIV